MSKRDFELEDDQGDISDPEKRRMTNCGDAWTPLRKLKTIDYTVGWISAIEVEYVAAKIFLDEEHERPEDLSPHDDNNYTLGSIGEHNVVIASLPSGEYGISSAAATAVSMRHSFLNIWIGLMVGIGGGAPSAKHDIRLGDIVVSNPKDGTGGLIQYDFGKFLHHGTFQIIGYLNQPPVRLRTAVAGLRAQYEIEGHQIEQTVNSVLEKNKRLRRKYRRPDQNSDRLYQPWVVHSNTKESCSLACDPSGLIPRPERDEDEDNPAIHYGLIASANQLMKNAIFRNRLAAEKDVLCFEMEAAGLMNHFPCLVIRGICDYSDSHKNKEWQGYAAMVAAAYAKNLLQQIPSRSRDILSGLQEIVSGHKIIHVKYAGGQEHKAVLDWLTPIDYAPQHNDFISRQQEGTGQWFLESVNFQTWLKTNRQTLFCPGIPGAGKTIMAAIVVNHLLLKFQDDPHIGIAYIYCNFQQQGEQTAKRLLTNLLKQLAQAQPSLPQNVKDAYTKHKKGRTRPSLDEITAALHSVAASYTRIFIVIDALDECQDMSRSRLLDEIFDLQAKTGANILATSRIDETIRKRFEGCATVNIFADESDVLAYLNSRISLQHSNIINSDIEDKIRASVLKVVCGMFLLATFHMDTIMSQPTRGEIKEVLQNLGRGMKGLYEIYKQAMERIESHTPAIRSLARRILTWIIHAKRPLSITEIQHALAVREHMTAFDTDYIPNAKVLASVCAGLVTTDEENGTIRLVHHTTQEFFQRTQKEWFPEGESYITKICLTYLSFNTFSNGPCQTETELEERLQFNPLYNYAAHNWGHHAREAPTIGQEVIDFLTCKANAEASSQALMTVKLASSLKCVPKYNEQTPWEMTGLHLAAYFGVEKAVGYLLQTDRNLDLKDTFGRTPLSWAAENGRASVVVQLLTTKQVEADSRDEWHRTPLFYAAANNHGGIVKLLLESGAKADSRGFGSHSDQTPLLYAAANGNVDIIKLLLDNGADLEGRDDSGQTALAFAAESGHEAAVQLLLDVSADPGVQDKFGQTPLSKAAEAGHGGVIQLLLDKGADLGSRDEAGQTPLSWAAKKQREAAVRLLLDKVVDIDLKDRKGRTPLLWTVMNGHTTIVQLLLDKGADINSNDARGRTSLSYAAENGRTAIVNLLLNKGADFKIMDEERLTPLLWAAMNGHEDVAQLLLDKGALTDIDLKDRDDRTPLSYAAENGHVTIVQLLLDKGADFKLQDKHGLTPLLLAKENGHRAIVRLLLDKGGERITRHVTGMGIY